MSDPYLEQALRADGPFDAVTIWLTGSHPFRLLNAACVGRGAVDETDLNLFLQNRVYELADQILRPGGVLQFVDRSEAPADVYLHHI